MLHNDCTIFLFIIVFLISHDTIPFATMPIKSLVIVIAILRFILMIIPTLKTQCNVTVNVNSLHYHF